MYSTRYSSKQIDVTKVNIFTPKISILLPQTKYRCNKYDAYLCSDASLKYITILRYFWYHRFYERVLQLRSAAKIFIDFKDISKCQIASTGANITSTQILMKKKQRKLVQVEVKFIHVDEIGCFRYVGVNKEILCFPKIRRNSTS